MPTKIISTAGTFNLKQGLGRVYSVFCVSVGTTFTIQISDGPDVNGNTQAKLPTFTPAGVGPVLNPGQQPLIFRDGIQVVTTGTPGSYALEYE